ncbi:hypothetical protein [Endozoicomonas ascidiicola]|uniref:hypothetical protein n=1 Tax=Endozoicomonas ascidiicola TaxID=1698521 RepID=UPI0008376499|nr:hypothetical protein [Endozoicomonas ascidiicola]
MRIRGLILAIFLLSHNSYADTIISKDALKLEHYFQVVTSHSSYAYDMSEWTNIALLKKYKKSTNKDYYQGLAAAVLLVSRCADVHLYGDLANFQAYYCKGGDLDTFVNTILRHPSLAVFVHDQDRAAVKKILYKYEEFLKTFKRSEWRQASDFRQITSEVLDILDN